MNKLRFKPAFVTRLGTWVSGSLRGCLAFGLALLLSLPVVCEAAPPRDVGEQNGMPAQPQVKLTKIEGGRWRASWQGVIDRSYFVQVSTDTKQWKNEPVMKSGVALHAYEFANAAPTLFLRLQYVDIPSAFPEDADFDGDGLSNIMEVAMTYSDPLDGNSRGADTDMDGLPDGWEIARFGNISSQSASGDPDGDNLTNLSEYQLRLDPKAIQKIGFTDPIVVSAPLLGTGSASDPLRLAEGTADGNILQWSDATKVWRQVPAPPFLSAVGPAAAGKVFRVNPNGTGWGLADDHWVDVRDFGAAGDGVADDSQAVLNAVAAAKASMKGIYLASGKTFRVTRRIVLDARTLRISGYGSVLRCSGNEAGLFIGSPGMATMQLIIEGLEIIGDGYSGSAWVSDNQILIDCLDSQGKNITLKDMRISDAKIGFRSRMTDYLQMEKILWRGNGTHWYGGYSTNVSFARGCAFIGKNSKGVEVTDKHCHFVDVDTCIFLNSEFGDGKYGLYIDSAGPGINNMITWKSCRTERLKLRDIQAGTGTPGPQGGQPVNVLVEQSVFMGQGASDPAERTHFVEVNRCTNFIMRSSYAVQVATGRDLVRVPDQSASLSTRIRMEQCTVNAGANVFRGSDGVTSSNQLVTYGLDGSATAPSPLGLAFRAPDLISSNTEVPVAVMPRAGNRAVVSNGAAFTVATGNVSDASNYWTLELRLRLGGVDSANPVCSLVTSGGRLAKAFVAEPATLVAGSVKYLNSQGVIVLKATKTGNPPPLSGLCGTLFYEPTD